MNMKVGANSFATGCRKLALTAVPIAILAIPATIVWIAATAGVAFLRSLDAPVAMAAITVSGTVIVSTITVVVGRVLERKRDAEIRFRETKIELYDEFLREFFQIWYKVKPSEDKIGDEEDANLTSFMREWQRKIILWGGQDTLLAYAAWMDDLRSGHPTIQTTLLMENFFKAIRRDLGHSNWKITEGTFVQMLFKNGRLFREVAKSNPKTSLAELATMENALAQITLDHPEKSTNGDRIPNAG